MQEPQSSQMQELQPEPAEPAELAELIEPAEPTEPTTEAVSTPARNSDTSTMQTPIPHKVSTPSSASHAMAGVLASGVASLPDNGTADSISLDKYRLGEEEYPIPMGLRDHQRQQYQQILMIHSSEILRFCDLDANGTFVRERLAPNMMKVLNRSVLASTHPYLVVPSLLPRNLNEKDEAKYILHTGEKFQFLDAIAKTFKDTGLKLGVVAREGLTMDLVAAVLGGKRVKYVRRDGVEKPVGDAMVVDDSSDSDAYTKATVVLVPSSAVGNNASKKLFLLPRVDLVVALDVSFDASEPQVQQLRGVGSDKPLVPVLRLVPLNTAEHALIAVASFAHNPETVLDTTVLSSLFTSISLLRLEAGFVPETIFKEVEALPVKLSLWIRKGGRSPLPIETHLAAQANLLPEEDTLFKTKTYSPVEISEAMATLSNGSMVSELIDAIDCDTNKPFTASLGMALVSMLKNTRAANAGVKFELLDSIAPSMIENGNIYMDEDESSSSDDRRDTMVRDIAADDEEELANMSIEDKELLIRTV
ncbi:class II histone deacetylase complex subunits 2 and 3-domain-containing protein [Lipomyces arxii]|uniref:class II histone deacetylase complex subunits 2 and 3-domain-containing protein n=1 Tax=Lipomyces arxii TaxID=56418 RepID=UPI0034CF3511